MPEAHTQVPPQAPAEGIVYQIELLAPVVLVIVGLIGIVWKQLAGRIDRIEAKVDAVELKSEAAVKELSHKIDNLDKKLEDKFERLIERLGDVAVDSANSKTAIFEQFVRRADCARCKGETNGRGN